MAKEVCAQCAVKYLRPLQFCGRMGDEFEYYVLDCVYCGKTIVTKTGLCCANNCNEKHSGRWHLTFTLPGVFLKVHDPKTGQSLGGKDEDVG